MTIVAACALAGCGPDNGLTMGRVSGTVTFNGEPAEFGEILFVPDSGKGNTGVPSMGRIDKDGHYVMSTQEPGDGVIAGHQKVGIRLLDPTVVSKSEEPPAELKSLAETDAMKARILQKKAQAQSMRKNRAKRDAPTATFNGKVYRYLAPKSLADPEKSGIAVEIRTGSNRVDFNIAEDGSVKVGK
jgi:hypothetical protein